jgi:hypothetical protein
MKNRLPTRVGNLGSNQDNNPGYMREILYQLAALSTVYLSCLSYTAFVRSLYISIPAL